MQQHAKPITVTRASPAKSRLSDEAIVERVRMGDLASYELLMRRYNQRLFRIARGIVANDHEAEDIVQEAYVRAYDRLAQFEGRAQFATWLTRIAVNEAITRRNRSRRLTLLAGDEPPGQSAANQFGTMQKDPQESVSLSEIGKVISAEVEQLPADLRTVFVMRAVEELDTRETADCLDLSEANVKIRLHRARALLRERIDKRIGEDVRKMYQFDGERCDRVVHTVLTRLSRRKMHEPMSEPYK